MTDIISKIKKREEVFWENPKYGRFPAGKRELSMADVLDAEARLGRFAALIRVLFPETEAAGGIIESPLVEIEGMRRVLNETMDVQISGRLFMKMDSDLAVAGSVKARGGIYEVLKHTEELALEAGILSDYDDDYTKLASPAAREFFAQHKMQVGSTGNLGMSIGIMSAALGYRAIVHMSSDAKQWKKDLLRKKGVTVTEYGGDYGEAVKQGREQSDADPKSYFVDDENSRNLFLGYAVAALRLKKQMEELKITVDAEHPMRVYIPCGVGGAPGGICFGLKEVWGANVQVYFGEPVDCPSMLLGLATGKHNGICVQDAGLSGRTAADGLACGRPSGFVGRFIEPVLSGSFTVSDERLVPYLRLLYRTEGLFIEPSSCAAVHGPVLEAWEEKKASGQVTANGGEKIKPAVRILWATGGSLMPEEVREEFTDPSQEDPFMVK